MTMVVGYHLIYRGSPVGLISLRFDLKWIGDREKIVELFDKYETEGAKRLLLVLEPGQVEQGRVRVGMGMNEVVFYTNEQRVGNTLIIHVYMDRENYDQSEQDVNDAMVSFVIYRQLDDLLYEKNDSRQTPSEYMDDNRVIAGLRRRI